MRRGIGISTLLGCGAIIVIGGAAIAELSERQKEFAKAQDEYFKREVDSADAKCETKLDAKIDWESFKGEVDRRLDGKEGSHSFYGYCAEPVGTLYSMCGGSERSKAAIKKKIKSYTCKFGGKGKRKAVLKGGALTYWVDWDAANNGDFMKAFLGKKL
jgi:hypothetical protein